MQLFVKCVSCHGLIGICSIVVVRILGMLLDGFWCVASGAGFGVLKSDWYVFMMVKLF